MRWIACQTPLRDITVRILNKAVTALPCTVLMLQYLRRF